MSFLRLQCVNNCSSKGQYLSLILSITVSNHESFTYICYMMMLYAIRDDVSKVELI